VTSRYCPHAGRRSDPYGNVRFGSKADTSTSLTTPRLARLAPSEVRHWTMAESTLGHLRFT